jgi:[protein-PII] uridylyltransferase
MFDPAALDIALERGEAPLPLFRETLRNAHEDLKARFLAGEPVSELVTARAAIIDELLVRAWRLSGLPEDRMALIAVGGYGRGELHPHSDIDLQLLVEPGAAEAAREEIERFLLFLWDIGLEVGHSVRTVEDCIGEARQDITVATNLMESRRLLGSEPLYQAMREATGPDRLWSSREFFEAKWQEQIARHHKFHDTAYNLEPNVKEGPGGLRDIQMIGWVAKRHFGAETLAGLVEHEFLTPEEYDELRRGQEFLWKVRFGLHILAGRREDRLVFDHQRTLAQQFGYPDEGPRLSVEYFMKDYYRTVMELSRLNEMLLQLFQEEIIYADDPAEALPLSKRFQARRGFLEATHARVFEYYPFALLEVFLVLAQHPDVKGVRAGTIRLIRNNLHRIDDEFRADLRCRSLFMEILRQPSGVSHELRRMNRYGVLGAYLPPFGRIVGQMQHDLFHVYTVDEHTLSVVRNLRRFTVPQHADEFPVCSRLINRIPKPELLYIAALFHDIAKGRGGDHSTLGAKDAIRFCEQHQLSRYDARLVAWLVRNHLLMSTTAQRKDISDPEVINDFAAQVGNLTHLEHLYLLTVADIRATSPTVWNSWKDALLIELYQATRRALRRGLANPIEAEDIIRETQEDARELLREHALPARAVADLWERLGEDYFLRYSADEIRRHTRAIAESGPERPLVLIWREAGRGGTEIFLYTRGREGLFARVTTALDQLGLNIHDARIIGSRDGYTLDTYIVLEENGEPIADPRRIEEIRETLEQVLSSPEKTPATVSRRLPRRLKHFPIPPQVSFEEDPHNDRTIVEVVASDRPGLLSKIGQALTQCDVLIQTAKVATLGERVEDVFFVTNRAGRPLEDSAQLECLRERICTLLQQV